jgi:hypothetical protein
MDTELPLAEELAAVFARMAGLMLSTETANTALELITALAREATDEQTAFLLLTGMAREQGRPLRGVAASVAGRTVRRRR